MFQFLPETGHLLSSPLVNSMLSLAPGFPPEVALARQLAGSAWSGLVSGRIKTRLRPAALRRLPVDARLPLIGADTDRL